MKFAIFVLLGLCAFAHASNTLEIQQRNIIIDEIRSGVDSLVQDAVNEFNKITSKVTGIADTIRNGVAGILSSSNSKLSTLTGDVSAKLGDLIAKGGALKTCAEQIVPQLTSLKNTAASTLVNCGGGLVNNAISYEQQISGHIVELKNSILEVYTIVDECSSLTTALSCAYDLITKAKTTITGLISEVTTAVEISKNKATETINGVQTCSSGALAKATTDIASIRARTQQCV